jgi:hypothetical protein
LSGGDRALALDRMPAVRFYICDVIEQVEAARSTAEQDKCKQTAEKRLPIDAKSKQGDR